jgi:hypothetical protein
MDEVPLNARLAALVPTVMRCTPTATPSSPTSAPAARRDGRPYNNTYTLYLTMVGAVVKAIAFLTRSSSPTSTRLS